MRAKKKESREEKGIMATRAGWLVAEMGEGLQCAGVRVKEKGGGSSTRLRGLYDTHRQTVRPPDSGFLLQQGLGPARGAGPR